MDKMNKTRQLILNVSKNIFLENGYSSTTFQMIADEANISKTSINYYYARKQDISNEILSNYIKQCREFVASNREFNELMAFMLTLVVFFKSMLSTPASSGFFYDLIKRNTADNSPHSDIQSYFLPIIYQLNLVVSPAELELKKISIYGATNELSLNYLTSQLEISENQFISAVLHSILSILKTPASIIGPYINSALNIYETFDQNELPVF
ncbi:MAG: TetR/AcrR family transcriptional regulator [Eubacteriaceae bacterium]|nr:TetR/AcrR family transcriptional regulator [Eubacteriaceae bacterium]